MTATARGRGWVLIAIVILLSSLFSYVVARPSSTLAAAGVADATTSTISADVGGITVDGSATITVQLNDEFGDPVPTGGDAVTMATTVGVVSSPTDNLDGTYTATLTSEDVGLATVTGTVNAVAITDDTTVDIAVGAASAATSTIESDVSTTTVDDGAVITVTLFDQYDNPLADGGDAVTLATTVGSLSTVTDIGDGTYTAALSSEDVGQATITGTVNSVDITDDATVDIAVGAASAATSTITAGDAAPNVDVGSTTITVELFDQYGNALTAGGDDVTLDVAGVGDLTAVDDIGDGSYSATLSSTVTGLATVTGSVNEVVIADDEAVTFAPGALDSFVIEPIGPQTAGTPFGVEITAYDQYDNIKTDYSGGLLGGLDASPGCSGCIPLVAVATPTYGPLTWTTGVGTASVTAVKAQTGAILTITDDAISDGETFAVAHSATLGGVTIDTIGSQVAGTGFTVTVRAFDEFGNVKLDQTGGSLSGLASSPGCAACAPALAIANPSHGTLLWSNGVATASVTAVKAQTGASITATVSGATNGASFDVAHSASLGGVTIDAISSQIAGSPFSVTVRAFDEFGNVKLDQTGGSLSGLASSPGCGACAPALAVASPDHGTLSWSAGVGTTLVTAVNAQAGASITATVSGKTNTSNTFDIAHSATLAGFTIDTVIGTQTAGTPFDVTVRAYDPYGNLKLDNGVGALSNLATSPGCPNPTCAPALPATVATYGTGDWSAGTKTFTGVVAYNAQAGATINIGVGLVGNTSNAFTVVGATANRLFFSYAPMSFDGSPIDTKISQPIYRTCLPAAPAAADPCGAGSAPVTVLAIDAYGNRAGATSIAVKVTPTSTAVIVPTDTTTPGVAPYGEAAFGSTLLATSTAQGLTLGATAPGALPASAPLQAVNDLEACDEQACDNNTDNFGGSNKLQKSASRINTEADFFVTGSTNVLLSTRFSPGTETNQTAACGSKKTIGDSTEVLISGSGVGGTTPASAIVLVMPKDTLKFYNITSRGTASFDICLGALKVDPASAVNQWKGKKAGVKKVQLVNSSSIVGRQWGIPADCGTPGLSTADPCIGLRTKQAAAARTYLTSIGWTTAQIDAIGLRDADLTIIVRKGSPWDGKMGLK